MSTIFKASSGSMPIAALSKPACASAACVLSQYAVGYGIVQVHILARERGHRGGRNLSLGDGHTAGGLEFCYHSARHTRPRESVCVLVMLERNAGRPSPFNA